MATITIETADNGFIVTEASRKTIHGDAAGMLERVLPALGIVRPTDAFTVTITDTDGKERTL